MAGRTLDAVLRRFADEKQVRAGERTLEFWRDADSEEVRLRDRERGRIVAVDEYQLQLTIQGLGDPITRATVAALLCDMSDDPERYFGTRVLPPRRRVKRRESR